MTTREMLELMGEIDERNGGRIREFLAQEQEAGEPQPMGADEEAPESDPEE